MIDNFDIIKHLFTFWESDNLFFHLQVIRRGKDHPDLPAANKVIQSWLVRSEEQLDKLKEDIVFLCEHYKARAYINVTPKSFAKLNTLLLCKLAQNVHNGNVINPWHTYNSAIGELKGEEKRWVVDVDSKDADFVNRVRDKIACLLLAGGRLEVAIEKLPTKNGCHFITPPFDLQAFKKAFPEVDVHKNNPTILYIPESLTQ